MALRTCQPKPPATWPPWCGQGAALAGYIFWGGFLGAALELAFPSGRDVLGPGGHGVSWELPVPPSFSAFSLPSTALVSSSLPCRPHW